MGQGVVRRDRKQTRSQQATGQEEGGGKNVSLNRRNYFSKQLDPSPTGHRNRKSIIVPIIGLQCPPVPTDTSSFFLSSNFSLRLLEK
jgi:hypothetical protein